MTKKIFTLLIALAMIISSLGIMPLASAEETDLQLSRGVQVLSDLNYFKYEASELSGEMTRAEFAEIISAITGHTKQVNLEKWYEYFFKRESDFIIPVSEDTRFLDVSEDYWAYSSIEAAAVAGYMSGDGTGYFRPDDIITYQEVISVIIKTINCVPLANRAGGWPTGYASVASELGILDRISMRLTNGATREDVANIIYNTFNVSIMENHESGMVVEPSKKRTFLTEYLNLDLAEGTITANSYSTLRSGANNADDYIEIDGVPFVAKNPAYGDLLGREVLAFYVYKGDNMDEIQLCYTIDDKDYTKVDLSKPHSFQDGIFTYETDNGKQKSVSFVGKNIILNGEALLSYDNSTFDSENGFILISEETDIIIASIYTDVFVSQVDYNQRKVYNAIGFSDSTRIIDLSEETNSVEIYTEAGLQVDISNISPKTVLSVIQNSKVKKVYISTKTITNQVTAQGEGYLTVGGSKHKINKYFASNPQFGKLQISKQVKVYINIFGEICWGDTLRAEGIVHGYIISARENPETERVIVKAFTEDGVKDYFLAENKIQYTIAYADTLKLEDSAVYSRISAYAGYAKLGFNSEEEIKSIEIPQDTIGTPSPETEGRLTRLRVRLNSDNQSKYFNNIGFNNEAVVDDNTAVFFIPTDLKDYESYKLTTKKELKDQRGYDDPIIYGSNYASNLADVIVIRETTVNDVAANKQNIYVVKELFVTINKDGETVEGALLSDGKTEKNVYSPYEYSTAGGETCSMFSIAKYMSQGTNQKMPVKEGDLVMCVTDNKDNLLDLYIVFDKDMNNGGPRRGGMPGVAPYFYVDKEKDIALNPTTGKWELSLSNEYVASSTIFNSSVGLSNPGRFKTISESTYPNTLPTQWYLGEKAYRFCFGDVVYKGEASLLMTTQDLTKSAYLGKEIPLNPDGTFIEATVNSKTHVAAYYLENWAHGSTYKNCLKTTITYEGNGFEVKAGTNEDILDYTTAGAGCSRIITLIHEAVPQQVVIINDYR